jgi:hypothetical protein
MKRSLLTLSLALTLTGAARADFNPIPLTPESFNADVVIEKTARPPLQMNITATMDSGTNLTGYTWFESGLIGSTAGHGLPIHGVTITAPAAAGSGHRYQMPATYVGPCTLLLNDQFQSATFTLDTPTPFTYLSVLGSSGGGAASLGYIVHFADGSPDEGGNFGTLDWFAADAASTNRLVYVVSARWDSSGGGIQVPSTTTYNPRLFHNDLPLGNTASPVRSVEFIWYSGGRASFLALSGSTDFGTTFTPLGVSGYNSDMVQESPLRGRTTATMDGGTNNTGNTFYQRGFNLNVGAASNTGLPAPGSLLTATNDATHKYQMPADYAANNAVLVNNQLTTATISLGTPTALSALSLLTASGNGPVTNDFTVHHQDGSLQTGQLVCLDWFNAASAAYSAAGRVTQNTSGFSDVNSVNCRLFSNDIVLVNTASPVTSIDLAYVGGGRTAFFALSGSTGGDFAPLAFTGQNVDVIVETPPLSLREYTTATMDGGTNENGNTWYEQGYNPLMPNSGLPAPGAILTSTNLPDHHYQLPADYAAPNGIYCDSNNPSTTITFAAPTNITAISFLSATANQGVQVRVILNHLSGTSETNTFNAKDWFNGVPAAFTASGRVNCDNRGMNNWVPGGNLNPRLYEAQFVLNDTVSPVTGATIQWTTNNGTGGRSTATSRFVILAVSATAGAVAPIIRPDPVAFTGYEGTNFTLWAGVVGGSEPITYQWQVDTGAGYADVVNTATLTGAGTTNLICSSAGWTNTGNYRLKASNVAGDSYSQPALVRILSALPSVTVPTDPITIFPTTPASPAAEMVTAAIDRLTSKWLSYGSDGDIVAPFTGPAGLVVNPALGSTVASAIRFYTANDVEGRDPADYILEGSNDGGQTWTLITSSSLALPAARNAAALALNPLTQNLQEVHFNNSANYLSYRLTVNNVKDNAGVHAMQIGEIEILGLPAPVPPAIAVQPAPAGPIWVGGSATFSVVAVGQPPLTYQWYWDGTNAIPGATNASYTFADAQLSDSGKSFSCQIANLYGPTNSAGAALSVIAAPTGNYVETIIQSQPIGYWRLDEANDGLGNNGVVAVDHLGAHNGVYTNTILGVPGYSVNDPDTAADFGTFSPTDSHVGEISGINFAAPTNQSVAFTVEAWVNAGLNPQITDAGIVTKGYGGGGEQFNLDCGGNGTAHNLRWFVREAGGATRTVATTNAINDGKWHHVVGVCDPVSSNLVALYLDGQIQASTPFPPNLGIANSTWPVSIGSRAQGAATSYNYQFVGQVDEVAIYDYALTPAQILDHYYAAGVAPLMTLQPTNAVGGGNGVAEGSPVTFYAAASGTPVLAYQWYTSDGANPIASLPGKTAANLFFPAITLAQSFQNYQLVVTNAYGAVTSSPAYAYVVSGPPVVSGDLPAQMLGCAGASLTMSVQFAGTAPFTYQWQCNGTNLQDSARYAGAHTPSLTLAYVTPADATTYQLWATNVHGTGSSSLGTLTVLPVPTVANGSFNNGTGFSLNGGATITGTTLTLTDGVGGERRSSFFEFPLYIASFKASFTYQDVGGAGADGAAFVLHNDPRGTAALGGAGGAMGYGPTPAITPSAALLLNIYANNTVGFAFRTNGVSGTPYVTPGAVNLAGGNPIAVTLSYLGGVLSLTFADAVAGTSFSTNLVVGDLTGSIGGQTAYVGFTGATGGTVSTQTVSDFSFTSTPALGLQILGGTTAALAWPMNSGGYTLQARSDLETGSWQTLDLPIIVAGGQATVTVPLSSGNRFYRLILQ